MINYDQVFIPDRSDEEHLANETKLAELQRKLTETLPDKD